MNRFSFVMLLLLLFSRVGQEFVCKALMIEYKYQ